MDGYRTLITDDVRWVFDNLSVYFPSKLPGCLTQC